MSRRSSRMRRVSGASGPKTFYGLSGWAGTGIATTSTGTGLLGTVDTPFWRAGIIRVDAQTVSAQKYVASYFTGATGWRFTLSGTNTSIQFDLLDGTVTLRVSPAFTVTAGMVGKLIHWYGWWDGDGVNLAINGVSAGAETACASYASPAGTSNTSLGARSNGLNPAQEVTILGLAGGDGVRSLADAHAHYVACRTARRVVSAGADHAWDVSTSRATAASLVLADLVGSANFVATGSASGIALQTIYNPSWV